MTEIVASVPSKWDRAGILVSGACAIHCAALPFVAGLLPVIGLRHFTDERAEWWLVALTAAIGVIGHASAYRRHHRHGGPFVLFLGGVALIVGARLMLGDTLMAPAALALGGVTAAAAHWANIVLCRRCCTPEVSER
jgi:hypothetical protein